MEVNRNAGRLSVVVAALREETQRTADYIVKRARAARQLGATAETYRISALGLECRADGAKTLLLEEAVSTFRSAAVENRLIAEALETLESRNVL